MAANFEPPHSMHPADQQPPIELEEHGDPAVVTGPDQRIVGSTKSAARLFGYLGQELLGRPLGELVPDLNTVRDRAGTVEARHRDGTAMRLRVSFRPVPVADEFVATVFSTPEPSEHHPGSSHPFDRLPLPLLRFDAVGRVIYANAKAAVVAGRPLEALVGSRAERFGLASPVGRTLATVVDEVLRTGEIRRLEIQVGPAGRETWFEATVVTERPPGLPTTTALMTAYDISGHRMAEAELEASELRFRRLAEGCYDVISQHSPDGRFRYASPAATRIFGVDPIALLGSELTDLAYPDDRGRIRAGLAAATTGGRTSPVEFRVARGDGSVVAAELTAHVADPGVNGEPVIICITRDITERVRGEEVLRAASRMEATATLAAGVAHDFNNLMTGILGNAELLLTDPTYPDAPARLTQISEAANRGGQLAQQLLAYARGGKYQTESVDLNEVARQSLHLQRHALPPRIQIEADLDPELAPVQGDSVQLGQVVTNLCINAAEAVGGVGHLTVRTRMARMREADVMGKPGLEAGNHSVLQVADDGPGIEPDVLPRIFEPFFSTKFQGRGLGLAAVYGIVKNHRGYIGVTSGLGEGTTFSIFLPAGQGKAHASTPPLQTFPEGNETILLVDDDEAVVDVTRAILERLHYQVLVARHGIEAVEIANMHDGPIHLALLDMGMPLSGGAEAFPFLKTARPEMKVLILSGYEMNDVVEGLIEQGAEAFLQKPYRVSGLARTIRRVLDEQRAA